MSDDIPVGVIMMDLDSRTPMEDMTAEEVHIIHYSRLIKNLAQTLADSQCPVCNGYAAHMIDCPRCLDYPKDRRGFYGVTWQSVVEEVQK